MSTSSTYDAEVGYDSFDNISPWTTPLSSGQPSTQHSIFGEHNDSFIFTPSSPCPSNSYTSPQPAGACTDGVDTWMACVQPSNQEAQLMMPLSFGSTAPDTPMFDRDFVLFDDTLQLPDNNSGAAGEAATLLGASIAVAPSAQPYSMPPPPKKRAKHSRAIPRTPPRGRAPRPRLPCNTAGCSKTFSRASDLDRHARNIHGRGSEYHECLSHRCLYRTRRKDKMQEHCQKVHAYARGEEKFATIDDGDVITPGSSVQEEQ